MAEQVLHFRIERYDDEDGVYFVATGQEIALVTEGDTLEDTLRHLRDAVELYYEGDNISELPRLEVILEVTNRETNQNPHYDPHPQPPLHCDGEGESSVARWG